VAFLVDIVGCTLILAFGLDWVFVKDCDAGVFSFSFSCSHYYTRSMHVNLLLYPFGVFALMSRMLSPFCFYTQ
jgi:hypothetical protein